MTTNLAKICGPVSVTLSNIRSGSVIFTSTVAFLNGNSASATAYKTALASDVASIFGDTYSVSVDTGSIQDTTAANTGKQNTGCFNVSVGANTHCANEFYSLCSKRSVFLRSGSHYISRSFAVANRGLLNVNIEPCDVIDCLFPAE